jgi:hypothetical protein
MGISISYLTLQVMISEPQGIYHPRLPAPFPSDIHGAQGQPTPGSTGSSVSPASSVTSGVVHSGSPGGPAKGLVDVLA